MNVAAQVVEARRLLAAQSAPARPQPITNLVFMGMVGDLCLLADICHTCHIPNHVAAARLLHTLTVALVTRPSVRLDCSTADHHWACYLSMPGFSPPLLLQQRYLCQMLREFLSFLCAWCACVCMHLGAMRAYVRAYVCVLARPYVRPGVRVHAANICAC